MSHSAYQGFPVKLLPKSLEILHSLSFSVAINSKIHVCCGRSRNLSVVKSQSYFISERLFFPLREQQGKIAKLMKYITYLLLWESGFLASVMFDDAHQAASYEEIKTDGCELTKKCIHYKPYLSHYHNSMRQKDCIRMTFLGDSCLQGVKLSFYGLG